LAAQELVKQKEMNASLKEVPQFSKGSSQVQFSKTKLNWLNSIEMAFCHVNLEETSRFEGTSADSIILDGTSPENF
jgi:hypothetical protein